MRTSDFNQPTPAHHHLKHPGGRLIKIGGQAVSLAPQLGQAFASLGASVSRIALGATLALIGGASASYADCVDGPPFRGHGFAAGPRRPHNLSRPLQGMA